MSGMITGIAVIFGLLFVGGVILFFTGGSKWITSLLGGVGLGTGGGVIAMLTDVWQYIASCFTGELGLPGYLLLGSIGLLFGMFAFNMIVTATDNKKGNFTFWR